MPFFKAGHSLGRRFLTPASWIPDLHNLGFRDFHKQGVSQFSVSLPGGCTPELTACSGAGKRPSPAGLSGKTDAPVILGSKAEVELPNRETGSFWNDRAVLLPVLERRAACVEPCPA